ncbi:MAG: phosphate ABC transporter permease subunit PstC [Bacteroidia bacterium]|nr:phosphate ABC transporter permease subunit PstC [Bacteroidia bacterium]
MSRVIEKIIEGILFLSSTVTTLTVLLIIIFLFREGAGVFNQSPVEDGFVVVLNKDNSAKEISAQDIKEIFDGNITNWSAVGGKNDSITLFRIDNIENYFSEDQLGDSFQHVPALLSQLVDSISGIIAFIPEKYVTKNFSGKVIPIKNVSVIRFLSGKEWFPTAQPVARLGVLPLILGTFWVSLGAIIIALPLGLATAIYMAEIANERIRKILKPLIELLAGIPSVVYGFFGLIVVVPFIQNIFHLPVGETALAGSIILGIMALPTIITISEDAIRTTPRSMKEASLALGANKWQTIHRVIIPYSISGISAAAILGIGRAMGETMAVLMVTGNAAVIPHTFLAPVRTIPATIAAELGEAAQGGLHFKALFALGCILFIITMAINLMVEYISSRRKLSKH